MACEKVFLEKLRERGLRLTPQREMILSTMHEMEGLVTAEAIYAQVQSITSAMDLPPAIGADTWPPNRCPTRAALPR
jgi:Fe2+ or Zn2+ uptake regulation protein